MSKYDRPVEAEPRWDLYPLPIRVRLEAKHLELPGVLVRWATLVSTFATPDGTLECDQAVIAERLGVSRTYLSGIIARLVDARILRVLDRSRPRVYEFVITKYV